MKLSKEKFDKIFSIKEMSDAFESLIPPRELAETLGLDVDQWEVQKARTSEDVLDVTYEMFEQLDISEEEVEQWAELNQKFNPIFLKVQELKAYGA